MRNFLVGLMLLTVSISCNQAPQEGTERQVAPHLTAENPNLEVVFSYSFKNKPEYKYQILEELRMDNQTPNIFSVLHHNGKEIDRNILNSYYRFFYQEATVARTILDPKLGNAQEILLLTSKRDNAAENAEGESSESVEWDSTTMVVGLSNNLLIEEIITESNYYFWYEGITDNESVEQESLIFPGDKNGLDNHLIIETSNSYESIERNSEGKQETCTSKYEVTKKLTLENQTWNNLLFQPIEKLLLEEEKTIYHRPTFCFKEHIAGSLSPGAQVKVWEKSATSSSHVFEDGEKSEGHWLLIEFSTNYGFKSIGYINTK